MIVWLYPAEQIAPKPVSIITEGGSGRFEFQNIPMAGAVEMMEILGWPAPNWNTHATRQEVWAWVNEADACRFLKVAYRE